MLIVYRILINFTLLVSPLILIFRLFYKKEDLRRFKEKYCLFSQRKRKGKLVWFHGASVGEISSIIPLIGKLEKDSSIKQILVTSNTLSSSKIIQRYKFKKLTHQFFPLDNNYLSEKFLDYWKPSSSFFIDSEIWPNTIINLKKRNIPIVLLNARITKRTFNRWMLFSKFANQIFNQLDLCLSSNNESKKFLRNLGAKKIKLIGNLKFSQFENDKIFINKGLKKFISSKKTWCASSTHNSEEIFCGLIHKDLKKKYKNLLTIIIPRHVERANKIEKDLKILNLKTHFHEPESKIQKDTDIYIVNSYGKTKSFYKYCRNIFLGGSIVKHGGQNPLEATRFGCNIIHGPNISNFKDIYKFLKKEKISIQVNNQKQMISAINKFFKTKSNSNNMQRKFYIIGQKILKLTYNEIKSYL